MTNILSIRTPRRQRETLKITRVTPDKYRVCDMKGQWSQYMTPRNLPRAVRLEADRDRVTYALGYPGGDGCRWIVAGTAKKKLEDC